MIPQTSALSWVIGIAMPALAAAILLVWRQANAERRESAAQAHANHLRCEERIEALSARHVELLHEQHAVTDRNTKALADLTAILDRVLDHLNEQKARP